MTRGTVIIRKNGEDRHCMYVASDAYPEYTGRQVISLIAACLSADNGFEELDRLLVPNPAGKGEDFDADRIVGALEGGTQFGYYNASGYIRNSLYCEYGYVIDITNGVLEFYKGFQRSPEPNGRYGTEPDRQGYFPCRHLCTFSFQDILIGSPAWMTDRMKREAKEDGLRNEQPYRIGM